MRPFTRAAVPLLVAGSLAACAGDIAGPPAADVAPPSPLFTFVGAETGQVVLCKRGPLDTFAEFSISSDGVAPVVGSVRLEPVWDGAFIVNCALVWETDGSAGVSNLTITETDRSAGTILDQIVVFPAGARVSETANSVTVAASAATAVSVDFKNVEGETPPPPPPPPGGGDGCTPGFWRQAHHFQYWTGYAPGDSFAAVFGVARAGTLHQNVTANGGGANALSRHAVAGLLNAASPEVSYDLTVAEVISLVQGAYASGNFEAAKNVLEGFNEQGCTVDKSANRAG